LVAKIEKKIEKKIAQTMGVSCDEQQQLLRRARWGWRNLVESRTVTDGWSLEESAM
jgi:hypothetical protein